MTGSVVRFDDLAGRVLGAPARLGPVRFVAVDGPAGSGKTTFAARLATALRAAGAEVGELHTDDLLEGWGEPSTFWPRLEDWILGPLRRGEPAAYRVYDWYENRFGDEWRQLPVPDVLIVEGVACGSVRGDADLTLLAWVTAAPEARLARGIARDGEALRSEWERWMTNEDAHFAADRTAERAHVRVDGEAPWGPGEDAFLGVISGSAQGGRG